MTTTAPPDTASSRSTTRPSPTEISRALTLARAEATLLLRNKTASFIAVLTPLLMVLIVGLLPVEAGLPVLVMALLIGSVLLFVIYYTLVTTLVARREEHYLKRLYTSTARPITVLVAMALPLLLLQLVQAGLGMAGVIVLLDFRPTIEVLLVLLGLLAGSAAWWGLALASAVFTKTVESAQLTTMPLLMVALLFSGLSLPLALMPDLVSTVSQLTPMFPVIDLTFLGMAGIRVTGEPAAGVDLLRVVGLDLAVLLGWTLLGLVVVRRWFRWEPRR